MQIVLNKKIKFYQCFHIRFNVNKQIYFLLHFYCIIQKYKEVIFIATFKPTGLSEKIVVSIRMDKDKLEQVDDIAHQTNISRNELLLQCIDFAIDHLHPTDNRNKKKK